MVFKIYFSIKFTANLIKFPLKMTFNMDEKGNIHFIILYLVMICISRLEMNNKSLLKFIFCIPNINIKMEMIKMKIIKTI